MKDGQILERLPNGQAGLNQPFLNTEFNQLYLGLRGAWQEARPNLVNDNLYDRAKIVDHALGFSELALKPGFHIQFPGYHGLLPHKAVENDWKVSLQKPTNESLKVVATARIEAIHEHDMANFDTPRHKQIGVVTMEFKPTEPVTPEDREAVNVSSWAGEQPKLSDAAYETVYRPKSVSIGLNYHPFSLEGSGRRSPLADFTVYPHVWGGIVYYPEGLPVDFGRRSSDTWLRTFENRNQSNWRTGEVEHHTNYFPGVRVPQTP